MKTLLNLRQRLLVANPYPAKRPWFPFTKDIFSDILPSALEGYPYTADILLWHMCTPLYSAPGMGKEDIIRVDL
jgi:tetrathionate reductase subunit A